ncbi:CidA/LrgA family holin-like protein [Halobacillus shinanisalinarum]|uniref:CidA/LrgA family holin-like protein n=1 Tax=Halobacillus shinanisalinarum TaxID=2932258 RepID=A0ABY4H9F0_9BACI|nr:CidA/LrgA family holin-like protein [Halobacillus shinanisalinarum]UOQ95632.1 CidA/LrgA family holin-like protein [Halobacillus shinanisalinarum]
MRGIRIILQIGILYVFSMIGDAVHNIFHIPIPGSIIGLILLLICLLYKIVPLKIIEDGASFLLSFLPLLYIPAMVGIMKYPSLISSSGAILFLVVVMSTIVTMIAAGITSQFLEQKATMRKEKKKCTNPLSQSL